MSENSVFIYFEITFRDLQQRDFPFDIDDTHQTCGNLRDNCRIPSPAIPMWKLIINTKSKITLMITAKIKRNKGVRLSPSARIIFERRLNAIEANIPPKITQINSCACWIISGGVCISNNNGRKNTKLKTVKIAVTVKQL